MRESGEIIRDQAIKAITKRELCMTQAPISPVHITGVESDLLRIVNAYTTSRLHDYIAHALVFLARHARVIT